ncbi:MAG TPA: universal stress protein [Solirubrobacteraceae bacterium]|nr:universal stress protein [Solirubrobacteraceae bacterium]
MSCYRNILVAHDGSADAEAALEHALALARDQNARLKLLAVVPLSQGGNVSLPAAPVPDLGDMFGDSLRRAAESVPPDIGLHTQLLRGNPAETILRIARECDHDLIVMGSHGHGRLHRALLGSVSYRVLRESPVPVLLIRHHRACGEGADEPIVQALDPFDLPLERR